MAQLLIVRKQQIKEEIMYDLGWRTVCAPCVILFFSLYTVYANFVHLRHLIMFLLNPHFVLCLCRMCKSCIRLGNH